MSRLLTRAIMFFFIVASFMISQTIHPTFGQTTNSCTDTSIKGLSASGNTQNFPPSNVIDNNFNTLWSTYGKGSWIQLDLGSSKNICGVSIAWYKGNVRQNNFAISTSTDGSTYKTVLTTKSSGSTLSFDKYVIPNSSARYVKIIVNGNTQNDYASLTEVKIQTTSQQAQCSTATIKGVKASASQSGYPSSNVLDSKLDTRWSNLGKGSWIQLDVGSSKNICSVNIAWYKGNERQNNFAISTSTDGSTYKTVLTTKSTGKTLSYESYKIPNTLARYVKITVNGNTQNDYASVTETKLTIQNTNPTTLPPTCTTNIPIGGVTASGDDGNIPSNVLDNNLATRWSSFGVSKFITADLGSTQNICNVDIAWYKGNERIYNFVIATSTDGNTFTNKLTSSSSGTTLNSEKYPIPSTNARYIKVTVNGNSANNWASMTEFDVLCDSCFPPPPPTGGEPTGDSTGVPDGVKMIYPTMPGGETWYFNPTNPDDGQFDRNGAEISKNSDGSWHLKPGTTRMYAFMKSAGLLSDEVRGSLPTYDYSELAQKGYFYKPTDWKNLEVTMYVKVYGSKGGDELSIVTRSMRHSSNIAEGCGGSSYHNNIGFNDGKFKFKKEQWHVKYDIKPPSGITIGSTINKWVGFKGIQYNLPDGSVKLETYVDKDNNNKWQKATELVDKGNWGNDMTHCGAKNNGAAITWGSPMVIFKATGVTYDFKKLSVRQIVPPT